MSSRASSSLAWVVLALVAGSAVQQASAAAGLRLPVIPWYSVLRGGYVDLITKQPVTTQMTLANTAPSAVGAAGTYQPQNNLLNPAPRPTSRNIFPITLPSLEFWEKCFKGTDTLSALITKCNYQDTYTTCTQLANMGYLPKGVQSFEATKLTGTFNLPTGCTSATLGVSYDKLFRLTFNSPQIPVLAVITKDAVGSMVSYFGTGSTQGRMKHRLATKAEFCYSPSMSEISVSKTAIYNTGMQPGTASWTFSKSVELAPPYTNNRAVMFTGDSADATWTLAVRKSGTDVNYQGVVSGTININNPTPAVITVSSIVDQVTGGPAATVACPVGTPFTVPACSFAACQYTAFYPSAPPPGTYTSAAQVSFQVLGSQGYPSTVQGSAIFNVGSAAAASALATTAGQIPTGAAMVSDTNSPAGSYMFSGPGTQTYQTTLTCTGASPSGAVTSAATLTGANGQQISSSATVQQQCYELQVSVSTQASPFVGRWGWSVVKAATPNVLNLKPDQSSYNGSSSLSFGRDYAATTTGDVVYSVTYTRNAPAGFVSGVPAFEASGEVYVNNPAPINANLQGVYISISNSRGGQPYVTQATCPVLVVPAGQKITCTWHATPTFNPVGQQVRGTARYLNTRNGDARGTTTDFSSPPTTVGGGQDSGSNASRKLTQTWGGSGKATTVGVIPEMEPAVATTLYAVDGTPIVVPNTVVNGTGVIVSGNSLVSGGIPAVAMASAQGVPVILPSEYTGVNTGAFVNEAGARASVAASLSQLSGLQDECVDIGDTFVTDGCAVKGKLISGTQPSGRICSTTTFTYTMRYGPYSDCTPRKSVNAATFQTVDTQTRDSSQSDITIKVDGCGNPAVLKVLPLKVSTSAQGGFSWTVTKRADKTELALGQGSTDTVTYTVDYKRVGAKAGASLSADVSVTNPSAYPIGIEAASYTATSLCDGQAKTTSGPIACESTTVPAKGKLACKIAATMPCSGNGAYTVVLTAGGGFTITSIPTPFAFNATALAATGSNTECVDVKDAFLTGTGRVGGAVVTGTRPSGKLCGSKTFTYSIKFGPFPQCGSFKGENIATLLTSDGRVTSANYTLPINVLGCSQYMEMARAADCVRPASWWPTCDIQNNLKCSSGWKLLPGGKAKATLFFAQPNQRATRTYGAVLTLAAPSTMVASKKAWIDAAQQFVAAQLNFLSGARLPSIELQEAYDAISSFLSTTTEGTAMSTDQVEAIEDQAQLLAQYNSGSLPASYNSPAKC